MFETPSVSQFPVAFPPGWGFSLTVVYLAWIGIVVSRAAPAPGSATSSARPRRVPCPGYRPPSRGSLAEIHRDETHA